MTLSTSWALGPFERHTGTLLGPQPDLHLSCPLAGHEVAWAAKDVFNPAAVVHDGKVHLLFRVEDHEGPYAGTSRIGLAVSDDGTTFAVEPDPVLFPADDPWRVEWPGGCEDPRVVASADGRFVCHYTAFDGTTAVLCVATSPDLRTWTKHGPAFSGTPHAERWSKSGAVVTEVVDGQLTPAPLDGRYWMYWGEGTGFVATSDDLLHWEPVEIDTNADRRLELADDGSWLIHRLPGQEVLRPVLVPRPGRFDSLLVEPGPPAVVTDDGILLIYNGANHRAAEVIRRCHLACTSLARHCSTEPSPAPCSPAPPNRSSDPTAADERVGQVDDVCFAQALVLHDGRWLLYYGMADAKIGLAIAPAR